VANVVAAATKVAVVNAVEVAKVVEETEAVGNWG